MNWTTLTGSWLPVARSARPKAAVLLPFPFPVKTRSRPRRRALASRRLAFSSSSNDHLRGCGSEQTAKRRSLGPERPGPVQATPAPGESRQVSWLPAFGSRTTFPDPLAMAQWRSNSSTSGTPATVAGPLRHLTGFPISPLGRPDLWTCPVHSNSRPGATFVCDDPTGACRRAGHLCDRLLWPGNVASRRLVELLTRRSRRPVKPWARPAW
jgi:hypothetical protein